MSNYNDDPRITLYALDQLSPQEAKEFEMEIKNNHEAQAEIKKIQEAASLLRQGFDRKEQKRLTTQQIENIARVYEKKKGRFNIYALGSVLATAACLSIVFTMGERSVNKKMSSAPSQQNMEAEIADSLSSNSLPVALAKRKGISAKVAPNFAPAAGRAMEAESHYIAPQPAQQFNTETYDAVKANDFLRVSDHPLSTFSTDVDTASYANARRFLNQGRLPPKESVRIEEFINYFDYDYKAPPANAKHPIALYTEMVDSPFHANYKLVKIGLKAKEIMMETRPASNLVFLIDVSGSMNSYNKLPLVKDAIKQMVRKMNQKEMISFVVYAGASGLALPPTPASEVSTIFEALNKLSAGGSTNGGQGIELAYKTAQENFIKDGNNRVIIVTDGDFNVGRTSQGSLVDMIKEKAKNNIYLTVLGVGMGNYKDSTLEKLADNGNGNYAYIDNLNEARKVLINDRFKTLNTIAKDVKLQVEFNPKKVEAYRLIGYENRKLENQDFNNDKKDAGDMGAGHTVTAFYEIVPKGVKMELPSVDKLKYQVNDKQAKNNDSNEIMTVKVRYKNPSQDASQLLEQVVENNDSQFKQASTDFKFASAVAGYAMLLRGDKNLGDMNLSRMIELAQNNKSSDVFGYRQEFIENMRISKDVFDKTKGWK